jgi:hypothetical protein
MNGRGTNSPDFPRLDPSGWRLVPFRNVANGRGPIAQTPLKQGLWSTSSKKKENNSRGQRIRYTRVRTAAVRDERNDYCTIRTMIPEANPHRDDIVARIFEDKIGGSRGNPGRHMACNGKSRLTSNDKVRQGTGTISPAKVTAVSRPVRAREVRADYRDQTSTNVNIFSVCGMIILQPGPGLGQAGPTRPATRMGYSAMALTGR